METTSLTIPRYRHVYNRLREKIQDGVYQPGDVLPSENVLCERYELTRPTIRQSLSELVKDGLIIKQKGVGSIVQKPKTGIGILNIRSTTSSFPKGTLSTRVIESPTVGEWPSDMAFDIEDDLREAGCVSLSRVRSLHDTAVFYERTYLPNINLPRFTQRKFEDKSLFKTLAKHYDIHVTGGKQKIRAMKADAHTAQMLLLHVGDPILQLEKEYTTNRNKYLFYASLWCNTDNYYLEGAL